jgi:hypothetical protein
MFGPQMLTIFKELANLLTRAAYASTYVIGIVHMIKIVIMKIKCYDSYS